MLNCVIFGLSNKRHQEEFPHIISVVCYYQFVVHFSRYLVKGLNLIFFKRLYWGKIDLFDVSLYCGLLFWYQVDEFAFCLVLSYILFISFCLGFRVFYLCSINILVNKCHLYCKKSSNMSHHFLVPDINNYPFWGLSATFAKHHNLL